MATAPFPFVYSQPYAYPSAAAYPPSVSGSFPAPAYDPCSVPYAATYHQPPHFTSPAFPYAAAYPYPVQPHGPVSFPYAATSSCPTSEATAIPTNIEPNWPPPAPDSTPPIPTSTPSCCWSSSMTTPVAPHHPATTRQVLSSAVPPNWSSTYSPPPPKSHASSASPLFELSDANSTILTEMEPDAPTSDVPITGLFPGSASFGPSSHAPVFGSTAASSTATTGPRTRPSAQAQACEEAAISKNMPNVLRDINRRLDEHQIQSRRSLAALQSELSKLVDMASSLNNSMAKAYSMVSSPVSRTTTIPTPSVSFAPSPGSTTMAPSAPSIFCAEASSLGSPFGASATADVAPQMFAEMPDQYDFHNLSRKTVFLADGTKRCYYELPEDYLLEQVSPPISSSEVEKVGVTAPPPVAAHAAGLAPVFCSKPNSSESLLVPDLQLPMIVQDVSSVLKEMLVYDIYEDDNSCLNCMEEHLATPFHKASENALSEQLLTCFGEAPETGQTSACLNVVTDVLDVTHELQQLDCEKASNCPVLKASDSFVTRSNHFHYGAKYERIEAAMGSR